MVIQKDSAHIPRLSFSIAVLLSFATIFPMATSAHPGGTAADGCHYCRTNCSRWGEVQGARHCHGEKDSSGSGLGTVATVAGVGGLGYWIYKKNKDD